MKTRTKVLIVVVIVILRYIIYLFLNTTLTGNLYRYGVKMNTTGLKLADRYKERDSTNEVEWIAADAKDTKLFLGHINAADATKYINDKTFLLNALYEQTKSPYPEVITNTIDCPDEFKPVKINTGFGTVYSLFAGERYNFGVCTKDLVKYTALYGLFDCGNKGVFEVKLFSSNGLPAIQMIMESFRCK